MRHSFNTSVSVFSFTLFWNVLSCFGLGIIIMQQSVKRPRDPNGTAFYDLPFYSAFATSLMSVLLHFLSFCSPYWLEAYPDTRNGFLRLGLWSVCFDKFIHQKDNFGIEWTGCYWIFDWNLWNRGMWEWIDPPWFIAVQVLCGVAFICHCIILLCMLFHFMLLGNRYAESAISCGAQIVAAVMLFIGLIVFGVKIEDRNWMPRPDHNHLSWSFAFAVLACFFSALAGVFLFIVAKNDKEWELRRYNEGGGTVYAYGRQPQQPAVMSAAGSVYAAGAAQAQAQYTMSMHSGYTQQQYRGSAY